MNKKYLTVKEVAELLWVKPVTIYKWLREGRLKGTYFKIGGVYRFKEETLEATIDSNFHHNDTMQCD